MFLQYSYLSSKILRCLLVPALFLLSFTVNAQDTPVTDSVIAPPAPEVIDEEVVQDEEVTEEEEEIEPSLRTVPDSITARLKKDPAFAYANDSAYWAAEKRKKQKESSSSEEEIREKNSGFDFSGISGLANIFIIVLLLGLMAFLIYKLMGNRWPWQAQAKLREVEEEAVEDLNVDELQLRIKEAIEQRKYRHAIRFSYLFTLRRLDETGKIKLDAKSTNHDYVKQMRAHDTNNTFSFLTNVYDYVWYGEFELNEEQFNIVYKDFQNYINTIRH